ncbi:MAG: thiolase family protein [Calditrichaeota bacterium]|nr:thiolase family protein [Calditrichota bacterium]
MKQVVIVDGLRSPFVKYNSDFKEIAAHELGAIVLKELTERNNLKSKDIDEIIIGNVAQPPEATNIARNIALLAGIDSSVPAFSVQRNCASGMQSAADAWYRIQAGHGSVYLTGGVESMSQIPFLFSRAAQNWFTEIFRARTFAGKLAKILRFKPSFLKPVIGLKLGLTDGFCGLNMGEVTERLAGEFKIGREEQDRFALRSHNRAEQAFKKGILQQEIMPVPVPPRFDKIVERDNGIRFGQSMQALAKLRPVFDKNGGTITAGNSSQITDGAAMLIVMEEEKARAMGYKPLGRLKAFAFSALAPERMGLGPAYSMKRLFDRTKISPKDIDLIEINEAFAAQVLANLRLMESSALCKKHFDSDYPLGAIDDEKLNVNGGAIALGHPVGASGARLLLTLLKELKRRNLQLGLATLCIGGGQGAAFLVENI